MLLILWGAGPEEIDGGGSAESSEAQPSRNGPLRQEAPLQQRTTPVEETTVQEEPAAGTTAEQEEPVGEPGDTVLEDTVPPDPSRAVEEATGTIRDLVLGFYGLLPKLVIALVLLFIAALLAKLLNRLFRWLPGGWERSEAMGAMAGVLVWLMAIGAALSVLAGDARALLGSVGLLGLALSWALQAPIESFAGWVLNSFRSYYRVGDRIAVGDVFGDVYRIDFLTTTVWEAGGPDKPVRGQQPTGASITFPNSEVLRTNLVNYTRDFPFVWDEVIVGVAHGTDLDYAVRVLQSIAEKEVGAPMEEPSREYLALLRRERLDYDVSTGPQVFVSEDESWTNLTVRYLIPSRERRRWTTRLTLAIARELGKEEHRERIRSGYPRLEIRVPGETPPR